MTGEMWTILSIGIAAISITTTLLLKINASVEKMSAKMEAGMGKMTGKLENKLNMIEFQLAEQNGKIDRLSR